MKNCLHVSHALFGSLSFLTKVPGGKCKIISKIGWRCVINYLSQMCDPTISFLCDPTIGKVHENLFPCIPCFVWVTFSFNQEPGGKCKIISKIGWRCVINYLFQMCDRTIGKVNENLFPFSFNQVPRGQV